MKKLAISLLSMALIAPFQALAGACGTKSKKTTNILGIDLGVLKHSGELVTHPEVSNVISTVYWFPFSTALRGRVIDTAAFTVTLDQVSGHFHTSFGALGGDGGWYGYGESLRRAMLLASAPSAQLDYVQYRRRGETTTRAWPTGPLQVAVDVAFDGVGSDGFAAVAHYPLQNNVFLRFRSDTGTLKLTHCAR